MRGFAIILTLSQSKSLNKRSKREAWLLPDGAELLLTSQLNTGFQCSEDGYYADVDNNCQVFHVCHQQTDPEGRAIMNHWTFLCGNQTIFNQLTQTCAFEEESVPCSMAPQFFNLNQRLGDPKVQFLDDNDIASGYALYPSQKIAN
ncbi:U-scoloptoxin(01)-Cw1a-like [Oppia nitens]|uniref:U-scoloptoxin(01)-Cw1a-like n=1 Tax=Oppia nitens TaxID=1686743 RepID=UPI0023DBE015|nr:U-scoloptoxin(01)-Cw1a-like [Oppia nitens]